jgi:hypothetical protein
LAVFLLIRFGLLAFVVQAFFDHLLESYPLTTHGSDWYAGISLTSNSVDGSDSALWLLHLPWRPTGFRRRCARGVSCCRGKWLPTLLGLPT